MWSGSFSLIEKSNKIIPEIIEKFIKHFGKKTAFYFFEKETAFSTENLGGRILEGPIEEVAFRIFNELETSPILPEILITIMKNNEFYSVEYIDFLKTLFLHNGYELDELSDIPIKPIKALRTVDTDEIVESWLETYASSEVRNKMNEAKTEFMNHNYDDALHDCRLAFEKLTVNSNVTDALKELVSKGFIKKGSNRFKKDFEVLQTVYHYTSTLGSHTASGRPRPNFEQTELGYMMTEVALRHLIKILRKTHSSGISLTNWIDIP